MKTALIQLRVTTEEKAAWTSVTGGLTLSQWIRETLNLAAANHMTPTTDPGPWLEEPIAPPIIAKPGITTYCFQCSRNIRIGGQPLPNCPACKELK